MSIYIISNRQVNANKQFSNSNLQSPSNDFRIAKCHLEHLEEKLTYKILHDTKQPDYNNVIKVIDGLADFDTLEGTESMFYELYNTMKNDTKPHSDVLFFIHGFQTSHEEEKLHILKIKELYIDNPETPIEHLIYISWPSSNHPVLTYWSDQKDAKTTGHAVSRVYERLSEFMFVLFKKYQNPNCGNKIHLMAHSMGNQVLEHMLNTLKEKYIVPFVGQIILLHSDVDADLFEKGKAFSKLKKLGQRTHIYMHKGDDVLAISTTTKNFENRLGRTGPTNIEELKIETFIVDVTGIEPNINKDDSFFNGLKIKIGDHWGYLYSQEEIEDIISVLRGEDERRISGRKRHDIYPNYFYLESEKLVKTI